jgi:type I restriction enzyme, S subunit
MQNQSSKFKVVKFRSQFLKQEIPTDWLVDSVKRVSSKLVVGFVGTCDPYYTDNDGIPMIRTTNVKEGYLDLTNLKYVTREFHEKNKKSQLNTGDLIVARHGENGQACLVRGLNEANCLSVVIVRPEPSLWVPAFFEMAFNSNIVRKQISRSTGGGVQTVVNTSEIGKALIFIPPLHEQSKIASIISKVDYLIQKTDQIIEQTQRLKKGLMQRLLTRGIGHTKFKKTAIGEIPEKWDIMKLEELLNLCQYGISEKMSAHGQYPIFRMNNIRDGYLVANEMKFIDLDEQIFEHYKLEKGDLLFNRTNSYDLVGKVGLFNLDGEYTFASYLIRLRTIQGKLNPFFLHLYLNTDWMQYKLKNLATVGVSQVNINATNLKTVNIAAPPTSEQERIVSVLYDVEEKLKNERERKSIIEKMKNGLMQNLLTGKIRVKV